MSLIVDDQSGDSFPDQHLPCPYRGLAHFRPPDVKYFFGRERYIELLYQATQTRNFIPLLGSSSSGKSSLIYAGLVPKLEHMGHWQIIHFRPGSDPFYRLSLALIPLYIPHLSRENYLTQVPQLAHFLRQGDIALSEIFTQIQQNFSNKRVLLIIDQFEDLYTFVADKAIRRDFLDLLMAGFSQSQAFSSVKSSTLLFALRLNFLRQALVSLPFADRLQNSDIKLGPMSSSELKRAIEKPSERLGVTFEAGLVDRILMDTEDLPEPLPLLEFALTKLWQCRQQHQLTHDVYTQIGAVQGALIHYADETYHQLNHLEREQLRRIVIQFSSTQEIEKVRRPLAKVELDQHLLGLVQQLGDKHLFIVSQDELAQIEMVDIHDALIQNWAESHSWITADQAFRTWKRCMGTAMAVWQKTQENCLLLQGAALLEAEQHLKDRRNDLSQVEQNFINQSIQARSQFAQVTDSRNREIRVNKVIAVISLLTLAFSMCFAGLAWTRANQMEKLVHSMRAEQIQQQSEPDPQDHNIKPIPLVGHDGFVSRLNFSPNGRILASGSGDSVVKLWDIKTRKVIFDLKGHDSFVTSVSFSPDGKTLVSGGFDKVIKLWDVQTGDVIRTIEGHNRPILSISFSPDGKTLASGSADQTIKLWNVQTGNIIRTLKSDENAVLSISFSPDGKFFASSGSNAVKLWLAQTGALIRTLTGHKGVVLSVSFSPDGKILASSSGDRTLKLWNAETGEIIRTFKGHDSYVLCASFSPDGKTLASGSSDQTIKVWEVKTGKVLRSWKGHTLAVRSVSFSPDGKVLASGSDDKTVQLWNLEHTQF